MLRVVALLVALLFSAAPRAEQAPSGFDAEAAISYSQAAIDRILDDTALAGPDGEEVDLSDFRGKPLIVNMVFTACVQSCPLIVQSLYRSVDVAQETFGKDAFSVVTVGFDAETDSPAQMRAYASSQGVDLPNWRFLSGDRATIDRLTKTLGFIYFPSPRGFDHLAQTSIVDSEGRIYRQVYGANFTAPAVVEPLKDLIFGRAAELTSLDGLINRIKLFCTLYNEKTGRYSFDYAIFIGFGIAVLTLAGVAVVLVRGWRSSGHA
ncbi:MAG: SCO family protein [Pseudomonadota bacterium]